MDFAVAKGFRSEGNFGIDFAAAKWAYGAVKWHSCAKGWFRSRETPFEMVPRLRNGGTWLRNGTRVPRSLFAATKIFVEGARRLRNGFTAEIGFRSEERDFRSGS